MLEITDAENNFSMENALLKSAPRYLPSSNPLYTINPTIYEAPPEQVDLSGLVNEEGELTAKKVNREEKEIKQSKENFRKNIMAKSKVLNFGKLPSNSRILSVEENF